MTDLEKLDMESARWVNRRKMAWASLYLSLGITFSILYIIAFGTIDRVNALAQYGAIILGMYGFCAGIIMAYIGSAAYSDVRLWQ